ncbi:hypothetical protein B0H14DRAFT_2720351, partial [Mycena olivaceomarginata]
MWEITTAVGSGRETQGLNIFRDDQKNTKALAILQMFGLQDVVQRLTTLSDTASASEVHDLNNILSLDVHLHSAFDHLKVAFEPVAGELNTYDVFFVYPGRALGLHGLKNRFTLIDHTAGVAQKQKLKQVNGGLPLPEPRPLALHAVCVRVAHMSGAAEVLDK